MLVREQHISFIQLFNNLYHYSPQPGFLVLMAQMEEDWDRLPHAGEESF